MKQVYQIWIIICLLTEAMSLYAHARQTDKRVKNEYVILASVDVKNDKAWMQVVHVLREKHQAQVFYYEKAPRENLLDLKRVYPRYVAIVEKPKRLNRDYVIDMHMLSREIDDDIFADFLWGIVTGYDADAAMKMVNNSTEAFVIKNAVSSITELHGAKWFDRYAWVDDHDYGLWGEKKGENEPVRTGKIDHDEIVKKFTDIYAEYKPDLVVTAYHATTKNLQLPFSPGDIVSLKGKLYARYNMFDETGFPLQDSGKRKVYFAVGNCLIGDVNRSKNSMAVAWMNGGNAATMIGYVVVTWHGRNGWGGLKYWLTTPGRYTLAEAVYLNQQDFLFQQNEWYPGLLKVKYPFAQDMYGGGALIAEETKAEVTRDQIGFWYDRDVLAYYGDPKWNVRLQQIPEENDFTVTSEMKGKKCMITIKTKESFSLERMQGDHFKEEHVLNLPFSYFFPRRLKNPRMAKGQEWKIAVDENFLLVYNPDFKPGMTYRIVLDVDK